MIAVAYVLNKLSTDSEIIVMNAAGMRPWRLFRPFFYRDDRCLGDGLRHLGLCRAGRHAPAEVLGREITADVLSNVLQTGKFVEIERNLTLRVRERQPGGMLVGVFIDDRRDPKERITIIAERGTVLKNESGSFLILDDGNLQRFEPGRRDPVLVVFDRNAFDMSKIRRQRDDAAGSNSRALPLGPACSRDPMILCYKQFPGQFRAELHDRLLVAALSVRVHGADFRVSRRAAHHAAKPLPSRSPAPSSRSASAPDRLRLHRPRGHLDLCSAIPVRDAVCDARLQRVGDHEGDRAGAAAES